jgi:acyl carrier protein
MDTATLIRTYIVDTFLFGDASAMLADDASLLEQGIIDSTGVLDLMMFMEEAFGIQVVDEDVVPENFDCVAGLARYAEAKRGVTA